MMMNLVAIPTFLGSRKMTVQTKTFLDDGHYLIQDGCHQQDCIEQYTWKMDGSNIPPRLGVVPLTNGLICNSDPSWAFIIILSTVIWEMGHLNHHQCEHRRHFGPHCCTNINHKPVQAKLCDLQPHFCDDWAVSFVVTNHRFTCHEYDISHNMGLSRHKCSRQMHRRLYAQTECMHFKYRQSYLLSSRYWQSLCHWSQSVSPVTVPRSKLVSSWRSVWKWPLSCCHNYNAVCSRGS